MYNTENFYLVTEANVLANDTIGTQVYTYSNKAEAQAKLYRLWAYGATPESTDTRQYYSATMHEYSGNKVILLESKEFDYRQPEPEPEPEPEET